MRFEDRTITLKDGRTCVLCPNKARYAEEMIAYLKTTMGETPFLLRYPDEVTFPLDKEREILNGVYADERAAMMLALVDGELAGNAALSPVGNPRRIRHRCELALALKQKYWGLGIGSEMIRYMQELGKQAGYTQMELGVVDGNDRARHLYEKMGFTVTGRTPDAMRYDDGTCRDEWQMCAKL